MPGWCKGLTVSVNGERFEPEAPSGSFVRITKVWSAQDKVEINMPMSVSLTRWPCTGAVTLDRGPLSYSVKIEERWNRCGGTDEWPEWEVFPKTPWNYGIILDGEPDTTFQITENPTKDNQPWTVENAPVSILAKAKRIEEWQLVDETVEELPTSSAA